MRLVKRRLTPAEMYPADEDGVRSRLLELASGLRVRVVEAGDAASPPIVLVPGWGCSVWMFHENIAGLVSAGYRVIAVDPKGHGLSDKPRDPSEYTSRAMRDHLIDILDALQLERVAFVGHSMGAAIAACVAAEVPQRVSALVMVAPVGFAGVPGISIFRALTPSFSIPLLRLLAARPLIRLMLWVVYGSLRPAPPRSLEEFYAPTQFPEFTRALRHMLHEFTWDAEFPKLAAPVLTIVGSNDVLSPAADAARYASAESGFPPVVVKGAGHVILDEAPGVVNAAITGFFRGAGKSRVYLDSE
jgi:pimeloyl-ACP methyl ester carboxylesterase